MAITNASKNTAVTHIPLPETLLTSHPIRQHFAPTVRQVGINKIEAQLQTLETSADSSSTYSLLGCVVDYAARLAGQAVIGACAVLEQELHIRATSDATRLSVHAQIESSSSRYAIYQCDIFAEEADGRRLIAESQGTLLKRPAAV